MSKFAIVTGASRGFGRGIAKVLASEAGYTVYATARSADKLEALAKEVAEIVASNGGSGKIIPSPLDQARGKEADAEAFVQKVAAETGGNVSLLVNSAYGGFNPHQPDSLVPHMGKPFWEKPLSTFDASYDVGVRSAYVLTRLLVPHMVKGNVKNGLILQISSAGGHLYLFECGYSTAHAGTDRLSWDMAVELNSMEQTNGDADGSGCKIRSMTLWPQGGKTEIAAFGPDAESPEFAGRCVMALAADTTKPEFLDKWNGKVLYTGDLCHYSLAKGDGMEGMSVVFEEGCGPAGSEAAMAMNEKKWETAKGLPKALVDGKPRGENDANAVLPKMGDWFATAEAQGVFPGCK
eukprot:CAMPEP_0178990396 /NCGR_PEP_ID=MMETSP0795-20121207/4922_1 /TAXON_ID=88552 /ORGANISM="Amoebophrya sp., Strain Ameob2" /LENGTH=349 /DNA_ID=CAMNT_0020681935 /DNA_START=150 /DNA_END=1199 /DNA_ORIENTATION=-